MQNRSPETARFPWPVVSAAALMLAVVAGALILNRSQRAGEEAARHLPFGAAEQDYARHIRIGEARLSRATNMLHEEFIYVDAALSNEGTRALAGAEVTAEFRDSLGQVVLRETHRIAGPQGRPIAAGETREFQIALESVPSSWNRESPSLRVTGLALE